ncbi:hypothetical protein BTJ39_16810 [Izhakiella australiensis]|uniref:Flagellar biosynthesis protein FlgN n=1 Tax=Izhakiella australiensis TaxID=1926881 RepID=A0A1S8YI59_9GAMM|nr:flagellar protein FlgN [Izhakiella australiensis]OON38750.1 hypothetical protein BTJ39_16810 [Izhakiella australiensis]
MAIKTEHIKALLREVQQDNQHYQQLIALLEQQHSAMISCNSPQLTDLNQQLLACYQQLRESAQRRVNSLKILGLPANSEGMRQLLSTLPSGLSERAAGWWQRLEQQTERCQQINSRNGRLLHAQQETFAALINSSSAGDFLYAE